MRGPRFRLAAEVAGVVAGVVDARRLHRPVAGAVDALMKTPFSPPEDATPGQFGEIQAGLGHLFAAPAHWRTAPAIPRCAARR
jgi:hypothetical protein